VIYGLLRTSDAASAVPPASVTGSLAMFAAFYAVLLVTFFALARRWLKSGPDLAAPLPRPFAIREQATTADY
jgi:cytochrome d ubiquinol oxidase subunit I